MSAAAMERFLPERFGCFGPPGHNELRKDEDSRRSLGRFLLDELRRNVVPERLRQIPEMSVYRGPAGRRRGIARGQDSTADGLSEANDGGDRQNSATPT